MFTIGVILLHKQQQQNGAMILLVFCKVARNYFHVVMTHLENKNNQEFEGFLIFVIDCKDTNHPLFYQSL